MSRYLTVGFYLLLVLVVGPLAAYWLAVAAGERGAGVRGFLLVLFGLPVVFGAVGGLALRRSRRTVTTGVATAVAATFLLLAVLVYLTLEAR